MLLQNPKGMKDFLPEEKKKMDWVLQSIKETFELYGFEPLETPALEYSKLLEGKYGEEEKLIYKFKDKGGRTLALRFDQTAPLARVVASNPQLVRPFKRYVIGKAWRYENPQKSRYREFYQADIDIIGSESVLADAEIIACANKVLTGLGFKGLKARINSRKLMDEIMDKMGVKNKLEAFRAMDKFGKIGLSGVKKELKERRVRGFERILELMAIKGNSGRKMKQVEKIVEKSKGLEELEELFRYLGYYKVDFEFDLSLVRGLDYYTGPVFEVTGEFGALAGGGRYDKLIGIFTGKDVPATGIAFGPDRIVDLMEEQSMFQKEKPVARVFVAKVGNVEKEAIQVLENLRRDGINAEIEVMGRNLRRQMEYVNKTNIPFVVIVGENDLKVGEVVIKDMASGEETRTRKETINFKISGLIK
jgi:histidyl-tRNA synthetase